ncbi:hypothetical protein MUK42_30157 [Musa troglodytarum]|uniref:RRM domain-containing protein n=1 Tax=Musa troglodytarum TaxID=320322 RepID=A0A9E7FPQ3_9LILI|nr:hypothetical protein MUK42_30157 [Musa troglodytarum]
MSRSIFCGNLDYDARHSELERLFSRYGKVDRVDMKSVDQYREYIGEYMLFLACWAKHSTFLPMPAFILPLSRELIHSAIQSHFIHMETFSTRLLPLVSCELSPAFHPNHVSILNRLAGEWFAFIYMDDERDAEDAIRGLDRLEFGRHGRRLRQERNSRRSGGSRRPSANTRPSKTLFVINFDPIDTRTRDLERHFEPYGKILNVRIRRNFGFVQFDLQEDATKALEATHMSKLMDRVISVEYAVRDDDERRNGYSPDRRGRERSRSRDRGRSLSPYGRRVERASPDYGRGPSPYTKADERSLAMKAPKILGQSSGTCQCKKQ